MAKNNNLFEEIQKLIQWIEANYQEGIDYKRITSDETYKEGIGIINILSPQLKKYCREKFGFPLGVNDYLDYWKNDTNGSAVLYRTNRTTKIGEEKESDILWWCKERLDAQKLDQTPKKCSVCGEKTFKKDARMKLWDDECRDIGENEDGWSRKVSRPLPLAYLHPECAKKYFVDNQNSIRIKEKLLRNLDKISLDPIGVLADAEIVKSNEVENNYQGGGGNDPIWNAWNDKVHQVEIEGEKINLTTLEWEVKLAVRKAIIQEIKQNPQDWKIENSNIYISCMPNGITIPDSFKILKHKSGRRHWNVGIIHLNESLEKGKQQWAEIEALINDSKLPISNKNNDIELEKIKKIFQEHHISKITFENGFQLFIEYDNKVNSVEKPVSNSEKQALEKYCRKHNKKEISKTSLNSDNSSANPKTPQWKNKYLWLAGGILIGVIISLILYFGNRKKKRK